MWDRTNCSDKEIDLYIYVSTRGESRGQRGPHTNCGVKLPFVHPVQGFLGFLLLIGEYADSEIVIHSINGEPL